MFAIHVVPNNFNYIFVNCKHPNRCTNVNNQAQYLTSQHTYAMHPSTTDCITSVSKAPVEHPKDSSTQSGKRTSRFALHTPLSSRCARNGKILVQHNFKPQNHAPKARVAKALFLTLIELLQRQRHYGAARVVSFTTQSVPTRFCFIFDHRLPTYSGRIPYKC